MLEQGAAILGGLELNAIDRELVVLQTATAAGCIYELIQHRAIAMGIGADDAQIALATSLAADRDHEAERVALAPHQRVLLRVAESSVRDGCAAPSDVTVLRECMSDRAAVEALMVIGYYLATAIVLRSAAVDLDGERDLAVVELARQHRLAAQA